MWPFGNSAKNRLEDALKDNEQTASLNLAVDVKDKVASITGDVPSDRYAGLIEGIASGINGIDRVDVSGLKVTGGADDAGGTDSSALAKTVLRQIQADSGLANNPLDVLQKGTTIVLRGAVDSQAEFDKAKELASGVEGVTAVDTAGLQVVTNASKLNQTDGDGDIVYTVKAGDTLSEIAQNYYGSGLQDSYMKIAEANGLDDPNEIQAGQQLKIPGTSEGPTATL
jgi:nucleoid-associated protein YgaU